MVDRYTQRAVVLLAVATAPREHKMLIGSSPLVRNLPYPSGLFHPAGPSSPTYTLVPPLGCTAVWWYAFSSFFFSPRSVTACNSPLNGSLLVYTLGEKAETAPAVRLGSHGHLLSVAIHAVEFLNWAFLRSVFDPRYI